MACKLACIRLFSGIRIGRTARSEMERSEIELPRNGSQETVSGAKGRTARSEMERSEIELPRNGSQETVSGAKVPTAAEK